MKYDTDKMMWEVTAGSHTPNTEAFQIYLHFMHEKVGEHVLSIFELTEDEFEKQLDALLEDLKPNVMDVFKDLVEKRTKNPEWSKKDWEK